MFGVVKNVKNQETAQKAAIQLSKLAVLTESDMTISVHFPLTEPLFYRQ